MIDQLKHERVYLDTNVIIAAKEQFSSSALNVIAMAERQQLYGVTSALTLAEVLVRPYREGDNTRVADYQSFLAPDEVFEQVEVTTAILDKAARLSAAMKDLDLPDAIHLASAEESGCAYFLSDDKRLAAYEGDLDVLALETLS